MVQQLERLRRHDYGGDKIDPMESRGLVLLIRRTVRPVAALAILNPSLPDIEAFLVGKISRATESRVTSGDMSGVRRGVAAVFRTASRPPAFSAAVRVANAVADGGSGDGAWAR